MYYDGVDGAISTFGRSESWFRWPFIYTYIYFSTRLKNSLTKQVIVRVPALKSRVRRRLPGRRIAHLGLHFGDYGSFFTANQILTLVLVE